MLQTNMRIPLHRRISALCCLTVLTLIATSAKAATSSLGIFQDHADVGTVLHPGSVEYDPAQQTYTISGSGANMWFGEDDFRLSLDQGLRGCVAHRGYRLRWRHRQQSSKSGADDPAKPGAKLARRGPGLARRRPHLAAIPGCTGRQHARGGVKYLCTANGAHRKAGRLFLRLRLRKRR